MMLALVAPAYGELGRYGPGTGETWPNQSGVGTSWVER